MQWKLSSLAYGWKETNEFLKINIALGWMSLIQLVAMPHFGALYLNLLRDILSSRYCFKLGRFCWCLIQPVYFFIYTFSLVLYFLSVTSTSLPRGVCFLWALVSFHCINEKLSLVQRKKKKVTLTKLTFLSQKDRSTNHFIKVESMSFRISFDEWFRGRVKIEEKGSNVVLFLFNWFQLSRMRTVYGVC